MLKLTMVVSCAALALVASPSFAQSSVTEGQKLASRYCVECHVIGLGQESRRKAEEAPNFTDIAANLEKSSESHLIGMLGRDTHNFMFTKAGGVLNRDEVHNLIMYIQSLKK